MGFNSESRIRVRYAETDQMGVVYYSNYLVWMEIGRGDLCRKCGFSYRTLEDEEKISIAVADVRCRYHSYAHYDDEIIIRTSLEQLHRRTMTFSYEITNAKTGKLLANGQTTHISVGRDGKPRALPEKYERLLAIAAHTEKTLI